MKIGHSVILHYSRMKMRHVLPKVSHDMHLRSVDKAKESNGALFVSCKSVPFFF